jgi:hypothetical protein
MDISQEFPATTPKSVSYVQKLFDVPVALPALTIAEPVITASPSLMALPLIFTIGTVSSAPSAVTAIATCFIAPIPLATVKLDETEAPAKLSNAWNEEVKLS